MSRALLQLFARTTSWPQLALVLTLGWVLNLSGCGGAGNDLAGVGSGGTGITQGAVSGFGSIIVDGVEYDDSNAASVADDGTGINKNTEIKLGQMVRVSHSANKASSIEVLPQLLGPVGTVPDNSGTFKVLGQWVKLVTSTVDAQSAPTVLVNYSTSTDIAPAHEVEVHGSWVFDSVRNAYVLVATRVEKLAVSTSDVQLGGVVVEVNGSTLRLNSANSGTLLRAASAQLLPAGLASGQVVRTWVARSGLAASPLTALRVTRSSLGKADMGSGQVITVSGLTGSFDPASRIVQVNGTSVRLPEGVGPSSLTAGTFVSLQVTQSNGVLVASSLTQRTAGGSDLGRGVTVKGISRSIPWSTPTGNPASVNFTLRGTPISAVITSIADSCRAAVPGIDLYVEVNGSLQQNSALVTATSVRCTQDLPDATVDLDATVTSVDVAQKRMVLGTSSASVNAVWDSNTYFKQSPESLPGQKVEVEGVYTKGSTELRLKKVKRDS
jgi:hypothetical protein